MDKITIRGVNFDNCTMDEAEAFTLAALGSSGAAAVVYTPNAEIVQSAIEDSSLMELLNSADLIIPDGAGVVLSSRILGTPLKQKVPGIGLGDRVCAQLAQRGGRLYILGGKPGVAALAAEKQAEKHLGLVIAGTEDGYFKPEELPAIIDRINASKADVLFVCLGAPRQEKWIRQHRDLLNVRLIMGLGGSIDVWSGNLRPVPPLLYKLGLEWLYRLAKQPSRLGRMMKLPKYIGGCAVYRLSGKQKGGSHNK